MSIASDRVTHREIADSISRHSSQPVATTIRSVEDAMLKVKANPGNFAVAVPVAIATLKGSAFEESRLWNRSNVPQYRTKTVDQYIAEKVKSSAQKQ